MPSPPAQPPVSPGINNQMPHQPPPPIKNKKSKFLILAAIAVLAFVGIAALVLFLVLDNNGNDNSAGNNNQIRNSENETVENPDQTLVSDNTEEEKTEADSGSLDNVSQATNSLASDTTPANNNNSQLALASIGSSLLDMGSVRSSHAESGTEQNQLEVSEAEIASTRQGIIDSFQELGIEESEIADFLAAYDYLAEPANQQKIAELSAEQQAELEPAILEFAETYTTALLACISEAFSGGTESVLDNTFPSAQDAACMAEATNQLGTDLLEIFQDILEE